MIVFFQINQFYSSSFMKLKMSPFRHGSLVMKHSGKLSTPTHSCILLVIHALSNSGPQQKVNININSTIVSM